LRNTLLFARVEQTDLVLPASSNRISAVVSTSDLLDLFAVAASFGLLTLFYADVAGLVRILFAVAFTFFVPGRAIVDNWSTLARWSQVAMSVVLSLVTTGLLATTLLWAHAWHPAVLFQVEAWLSLAGLGVGAARRHDVAMHVPGFLYTERPQLGQLNGAVPRWVGLVELDGTGAIVAPDGQLRPDHERARMLVRMHHAPLGYVDVEAHPKGSLDRRSRSEANNALGVAVQGHVACDAVADDPITSELWFARAACPLRFPKTGVEALSIAVCTRNRATSLRECLRSLRKVEGDQIEILVVDNAPADNSTRDLVTNLAKRDKRIRYTCEPNPGLSHARNHALSVARFEHLAFTDDDVSVDSGWTTALAAGFSLDPEVVCVTGLVASATLETPSQRYFDSRIPWGEAFVPRRYDLGEHRDPFPLFPFNAGAFGAGANFAVRTAAVKKIGGFDTRLGVGGPGRGGEDLDIFVRLILAGGRICYIPSALVWHTERADAASLRRQMYDYGHGLGAYLAKHIVRRELRAGLMKHGVSHARSILSRQTTASRMSNLGRKGMGLAITEARGVVFGALRYWFAPRRKGRDSARQESVHE
jgi:GT2 family glycosyltransferase